MTKTFFTDYSGREWSEEDLNETLKGVRELAGMIRWLDWF